ncbi:MAG: aminoacetone oxidase family FAD-binding enzyme [Candidatus Gracilibacteria bacterium]
MNSKPLTLAIIGGGAAGLMAAATICEKNPDTHVLLIDKNVALGQKIRLTGGGRCNLTTAIADPRDVLAHYPRGSRFLRFAMHEFSPQKAYEWFESHGLPLKTEERFRVLPESDSAHDVVGVFEKIFEAHPETVRVLLGHSVKKIEKTKKGFSIEFEKNLPILVDRVLLTTGGKVQPGGNPTIDGYTLSASLGHTITPLAPGLQALCLEEPWVRDLAGLAFPKARLTLTTNSQNNSEPTLSSPADSVAAFASATLTPKNQNGLNKPKNEAKTLPGQSFSSALRCAEKGCGGAHSAGASCVGPFLFTHEGVSGPAVFALSSQAAYEDFSAQNPASLCIDFFPDENFEQLSSRLKSALAEHPHQTLKNTLRLFGLRTFKEVLLWVLGISGDKRNDQVSKKEILRLVEMLKRTPCQAIGRKSGEEIVTAGGVALDEVDSKTMASQKCPGLFLAGELLDVDAETGGFNLQAAWATGKISGENLYKQDPSAK